MIPGTDATLQTMWEKELSYWNSYDHFKEVYTNIVKKHHKMIMYHCDILNNWDLMKHIMDDQTDDKKILWTSMRRLGLLGTSEDFACRIFLIVQVL